MQVNSAQDYLTNHKRRVIGATYHSIPPPQSRRTNDVFLMAMANGAAQYHRVVSPATVSWGAAPGGRSFISYCCLSNGAVGAPGAFATVTSRGVVPFSSVPPMSYRATVTSST